MFMHTQVLNTFSDAVLIYMHCGQGSFSDFAVNMFPVTVAFVPNSDTNGHSLQLGTVQAREICRA